MERIANWRKIKVNFLFMCIIILIVVVAFDETSATAKIKLNKKNITIYVGNTMQLKMTGTKKKVKWSSNKKKIVKVTKNGEIKGIKAGKAIITAKVGEKKYTCKATVKKVQMNKKNTELTVGEQIKLKILGNKKTVKWYSDNKSIATVNKDGLVTAKKEGITIVNAKISKRLYCCVVVVKKDKNTMSEVTPTVTSMPSVIEESEEISSLPVVKEANEYLEKTIYESKEENMEQINFVLPKNWTRQIQDNKNAYQAYFPEKKTTTVTSGILVGAWERGGLTEETLEELIYDKVNIEKEKMENAGCKDLSVNMTTSEMETGNAIVSFWKFSYNNKIQTMLVYNIIIDDYLIEVEIVDVQDDVEPSVYDIGRNIVNSLKIIK